MGYIADLTIAEMERIEKAKADIRAALISKGFSVSSNKKISEYAEIINNATVLSPCSVTITNKNLNNSNLVQLPITVAYTTYANEATYIDVAVGESVTINSLKNTMITAFPKSSDDFDVVQKMLNNYSSLYCNSKTNVTISVDGYLKKCFSATAATASIEVYWA